jgi:hypothetical protein
MSERTHASPSETLSSGMLGCLVLPVATALILVTWFFALSRSPEVDDISTLEPEACIDPAFRRANIVRAAAAVLAREHTPLRDGTPELVVVDVRDGERWAWWSRARELDRGGRMTWRSGTLPDASLPTDGSWHPLWSDGQIALDWQNHAGSLVVREVRAPGAAVGLRTMVSHSRSFRGLHILAVDLNDNAIFSGTAGMFVTDRWPRPLDATLLIEERDGEVVLDLTLGR